MGKMIKIEHVEHDSGRIAVKFSTSDSLAKYFNPQHDFWCEYPQTDISSVPDGIAVIPFVANVLPIVWLTDAELVIPELDMTFFKAIPNIKKGYEEMYPMLDFRGEVTALKLTDNKHDMRATGAICLFSGGVDAYCTLYEHVDERPRLLTLWGADVKLEDENGWTTVNGQNIEAANKFGLKFDAVKSNFRMFINERRLDTLVATSNDGYWHGFQHGIGLISHSAPIAWTYNIKTVYIASSYTKADKGNYTCASDPTIDNYLCWAESCTVHDGYEYTRQQKVHIICAESERIGVRPNLRVCWIETGGCNCCHCEKCLRTMFELIAEGRNPKNYGFDYTEKDLKQSQKIVLATYSHIVKPAWREIQSQMKQLRSESIPDYAKWVLDCDFEHESRKAQRINAFKSIPIKFVAKIRRL